MSARERKDEKNSEIRWLNVQEAWFYRAISGVIELSDIRDPIVRQGNWLPEEQMDVDRLRDKTTDKSPQVGPMTRGAVVGGVRRLRRAGRGAGVLYSLLVEMIRPLCHMFTNLWVGATGHWRGVLLTTGLLEAGVGTDSGSCPSTKNRPAHPPSSRYDRLGQCTKKGLTSLR